MGEVILLDCEIIKSKQRESNVKIKSDLTAGDITYYKNESIKHTWAADIITFIDNTWFTRGQTPIT